MTLLPAVVMGRFQHSHTLRSTATPPFGPGDIEGKRIGIRSYTQTTGIWVRGIFKHEYGVDLNKVTWVCNDDGHLAEFRDPPNVERTPPDAKKVDQMLLDGEIDGAILGVEISTTRASRSSSRIRRRRRSPGTGSTTRSRSITCSASTGTSPTRGRT